MVGQIPAQGLTGRQLAPAAFGGWQEPASWLVAISPGTEHVWIGDDRVTVLLAGNFRRRHAGTGASSSRADDYRWFVEGWARQPLEPLRELAGAFVMMVLDYGRGEVTLAVDRMGIMPLSYALGRRGELIFATSTTVVRTHPEVASRLSPQSLYDYVHFHMIPSPATAFVRIGKLEPAQCLQFRAGRVSLSEYWTPTFGRRGGDDRQARMAAMRAVLDASVRRHLDGPPVGTFLSGGIDSSTVTGLAARAAHSQIPAYSMGFAASGYDEAHYAQVSASHFGAALRQFYVEASDIERELPAVAAAYDEPFGNSSAIPTLVCARRARADGITRLLAGDGGDELFGGNTRYAKQKLFEVYHSIPQAVRHALIEPALLGWGLPSRVPLVSKLASYVRQARMPMPDRTDSYNFLELTPRASIFTPEFLAAVDPRHPCELLQSRYARSSARDFVDRMLFLDWKFTLADNDLRKVGRMCELAGVEVRFPWLDDEVIDFSTTLSGREKVRGQHLRWFAKQALAGFLPNEVIAKTKHGFGLPFGEWLKTSPTLQAQVYALLDALGKRGMFRPDFIASLIEQHRVGHAAYYGTMVWVLAMLEAWLAAHRLDL